MSLYSFTFRCINNITWLTTQSEIQVVSNTSLHSSEVTQDSSLLCVKPCAVWNIIRAWCSGFVQWAGNSGNVRLSRAPCAGQVIRVHFLAGVGSQCYIWHCERGGVCSNGHNGIITWNWKGFFEGIVAISDMLISLTGLFSSLRAEKTEVLSEDLLQVL